MSLYREHAEAELPRNNPPRWFLDILSILRHNRTLNDLVGVSCSYRRLPSEPINKPNSERMTSSDSCAFVGPPQRTTSTQANLTMMHRPRNVMCWQNKAISESLRRVVISSPANRSVHTTMPSPTRHTYVSDRLCSFARPGGLNVCSQHVHIVCKWDRRTESLCRFARFNASMILNLRQSRLCQHPDFIRSLE